MAVLIATWVVRLVAFYLFLGVLFVGPFVAKGVNKIDPTAADGTPGFRLLIIPGVIAFWPLLAGRWIRGVQQPPEENNPHREAARLIHS